MLNQNLKYQSKVNLVAERLAKMSSSELLDLPHYSTMTEDGLEVGIWHHDTIDDEHHIVVQAQRRVFLLLWKNYLNGIIVKNNLQIILMPNKVIASYD